MVSGSGSRSIGIIDVFPPDITVPTIIDVLKTICEGRAPVPLEACVRKLMPGIKKKHTLYKIVVYVIIEKALTH